MPPAETRFPRLASAAWRRRLGVGGLASAAWCRPRRPSRIPRPSPWRRRARMRSGRHLGAGEAGFFRNGEEAARMAQFRAYPPPGLRHVAQDRV